MLSNPIYCGKIRAAGKTYPGRQTAIIASQLWDQVQSLVTLPQQQRRAIYSQRAPALLSGLVVCAGCRKPLNACYRSTKSKQRPVYYRHPSPKQNNMTQLCRTSAVNASRLEALVLEQLQSVSTDQKMLTNKSLDGDKIKALTQHCSEPCHDAALQRQLVQLLVKQVLVHQQHVELEIKVGSLQSQVTKVNSKGKKYESRSKEKILMITIPFPSSKQAARKLQVEPSDHVKSLRSVDKALVKTLAKAYRWQKQLDTGKFSSITNLASHHQVGATYASKILRINLLSPKIKLAILNGTQPSSLTLQKLMNSFPLLWSKQDKFFEL